ncbi:hypothetical protein D3C87_1813690 [compost metagenome]
MPVGPPAILADATGMANGGQYVYQWVRFFAALIGKLVLLHFYQQFYCQCKFWRAIFCFNVLH